MNESEVLKIFTFMFPILLIILMIIMIALMVYSSIRLRSSRRILTNDLLKINLYKCKHCNHIFSGTAYKSVRKILYSYEKRRLPIEGYEIYINCPECEREHIIWH